MYTACFLPARCSCLRRDWLPYPILLLFLVLVPLPLEDVREENHRELSMGHSALAAARSGAWSKRLRQAKVQEADKGRKKPQKTKNKISGH